MRAELLREAQSRWYDARHCRREGYTNLADHQERQSWLSLFLAVWR